MIEEFKGIFEQAFLKLIFHESGINENYHSKKRFSLEISKPIGIRPIA